MIETLQDPLYNRGLGLLYKLVIDLYIVTDLLQVVPTRLIQAVLYELCHKLGNNLLGADDIRLVSEQPVTSLLASSTLLQDDNNLFQTS
jgi:hypothetical protein